MVENGLFVDICDILILGKANGEVKVYDRLTNKITNRTFTMDQLKKIQMIE